MSNFRIIQSIAKLRDHLYVCPDFDVAVSILGRGVCEPTPRDLLEENRAQDLKLKLIEKQISLVVYVDADWDTRRSSCTIVLHLAYVMTLLKRDVDWIST